VKTTPRRMLEMTVSQLTVDPFTNMPILILKAADSDQSLPIWIGLLEASAIASELEKVALERPMTHDLLKNLVSEAGLKVDCVEIHDVKENTFYACIRLSGPRKRAIELDARPSDAVALALRTGARIRVARKVVERMQKIDLMKRPETAPALPMGGVSVKDAARLRELLENLTDDHFGKWKM
jgi:bifunctional DNase/RNase